MSSDSEEKRTGQQQSLSGSYVQGLSAAVRNNASAAYGFSVTITASFGLLTSALRTPTPPEIFAFAGGAGGRRLRPDRALGLQGLQARAAGRIQQFKNVGSSVSILSVGVGILCAYAIGRVLDGFAAWPVGALVATLAYLFLFGVDLGLTERLQRAGRSGKPGG